MSFQKHLSRIRQVHRTIKFKRSGTPEEFADKLGIAVSTLYKLLTDMRAMGAPIYYCHLEQCYAYYEPVDLQVGFAPVQSPTDALGAAVDGATVRQLPTTPFAA